MSILTQLVQKGTSINWFQKIVFAVQIRFFKITGA